MKNNYDLKTFEVSDDLVQALSLKIISELHEAIQTRGSAFLAVSGGSTPKKLFQALSKLDLEWSKVTITLVDERWVPPYEIDSNENLVREHLMQNKAKDAKFIALKNIMKKAIDGEVITLKRLQKIDHLDVVILGMGTDAHTASFFPHAHNLEKLLTTEDLCSATQASAKPKDRMTLTKNFLLSAKSLILHIEGESKKTVFDAASQSDDLYTMPIIAMMQQEKPTLEVYYAK